ncbi:hypothetical protein GCM10027075_76050 [Streptomyces heilongjiangensis]
MPPGRQSFPADEDGAAGRRLPGRRSRVRPRSPPRIGGEPGFSGTNRCLADSQFVEDRLPLTLPFRSHGGGLVEGLGASTSDTGQGYLRATLRIPLRGMCAQFHAAA